MRILGTCRITEDLYTYLDAQDLKGKVCIDIPAGSGTTAKYLKGREAAVEAYDLFPNFFEVEGMECKMADLAGTLPIEDNHADIVICQEGIEHLADPLLAMREFSRILKPGGQLLVTTPSISNMRGKVMNLLIENNTLNRLPANETDSIWFSRDESADENDKADKGEGKPPALYFGHVFLISVQKLRILGRLSGLVLDQVHPTKISWGSVLLGIGLYPFLLLGNLYSYWRSTKRLRNVDAQWARDVCWDVLKLNLNWNMLFGKHTFLIFSKDQTRAEAEAMFHSKLNAKNESVGEA